MSTVDARAVVLVVDDDPMAARSVARALTPKGHVVRIETNSAEALRLLESEELYDLVFLDVLMPEPTGEQIVRQLEKTAPARLRRIVFLTGMAYLVEVWLRRTGIPFIEKPADVSTLLRTAEQFARLDAPRGPHMPKKKHSSLPDLSDVAGDGDDDEEDTGVTILKIARATNSDPPPSSHGNGDENPHIIVVKWMSKKHSKLAKRLVRLEAFVLIGYGFFLALYVAFEIFKAAGHK